ncbi:MAG: hypothetical protein JWO63_130 [Frankiales bacterium]|jgi:hypothetical protein|nr:hypothetical protein [Frankiales bacterium]
MSSSTTPPDDVVDRVRGILGQAKLGGINYLDLGVRRVPDVEPTPAGQAFPVSMTLGFQVLPAAVIYQLGVEISRPDLDAHVVMAIIYTIPDSTVFEDPDVVRVFGEKVAIPAAYPFARGKMNEITQETGVAPVMLDLLDVSTLNFAYQPGVGAAFESTDNE